MLFRSPFPPSLRRLGRREAAAGEYAVPATPFFPSVLFFFFSGVRTGSVKWVNDRWAPAVRFLNNTETFSFIFSVLKMADSRVNFGHSYLSQK